MSILDDNNNMQDDIFSEEKESSAIESEKESFVEEEKRVEESDSDEQPEVVEAEKVKEPEIPFRPGANRAPNNNPGAPRYPYNGSNPAPQGNQYGAPNSQYYRPGRPNPYANRGYNQPYPYNNPGMNPPQNNPYPYQNPNNANPVNNGYAYQKKEEDAAKKKKNTKVFAVVAAILFVGIMVGVVVGIFGNSSISANPSAEPTNPPLNVEEFSTGETPNATPSSSEGAKGVLSPRDIFNKVKESSVGILVYGRNKSLSSEGTGIIMSEDKDHKYTYIVTCAHVISDKNSTIMVQLYNGKDYAAQVVGFDAKTDIGVIRIEASGLKAPEYGDSSKLSVGDKVYAIGNPGGTEFANSFTNGMISAIDRPVSSSSTGYTMECIQHTAAINPGNSGGALVNEYGQVIGVNSMKIIADEYEGMGFSVPSSVFINIVNEIIANGYVSNRPKLGITYVSASSEQSYAMYVAIKGLPSGSIIVYSISDDSDLKNSDVKKGDMIVSINGKKLDEASYISEVIEHSKVGDTVTLGIVRIKDDYTSEEFDVKVTLTEDRGDVMPEEETSSSPFGEFFDGNGEGSENYDPYEDFFNEFFGRAYGEGR